MFLNSAILIALLSPFPALTPLRDTSPPIIAQVNPVPAALLEQGIQHREQGRYDEATTTLEAALTAARQQGDRASECLALVNLSVLSLGSGNLSKATAEAQQALTIAQDLDNPTLVAESLNSLGVIAAIQEDYPTAIRLYQDALSLVDESPDINRQLWNRLGLAYFWQEDYDQALRAYGNALPFAEAEGNSEKIATTLGFIADAYAEQGANAEAVAHYQRSLDLTTNPNSRQSALSSLGHIYFSEGQLEEAIQQYEGAIAILRQLNDTAQEYPLLNVLASAQLGLRQFTAARNNAQRSITLAEGYNDLSFVMDAWSILGQAQTGLNQTEQAITAYEEAISLAKRLDDPRTEVLSLMSLGSLHQGLGNYLTAIDHFEQVLGLTEQTQADYRLLAEDALKFLGQIHIILGDYGRAIAYFEQNLNFVESDNNPHNDIAAYQKIGDAYYASGRYADAIDYYQRALTQAETSNNVEQQVYALTNLVSGYRSLSQWTDAQQQAEKAVQISQSLDDPWAQGTALWELGNVQLLTQNARALETFQALLTLSQQPDAYPQTLALRSLGEAHLAFGSLDTAIELLQQALTLSQQEQDVQSMGETLSDLGRAYQAKGDLETAEMAFRQAVTIWESLRSNFGDRDDLKVSFLNRQRVSYQQLQTVLIAQGKTIEALEVAEQGRARALTELLSQQLPSELATGAADSPRIEAPSVAEMQQIAQDQQSTLVVYSQTLESLYIWVIEPSGEIHFESVEVLNPDAVLPAGPNGSPQSNLLGSAIADTRSAFGVANWDRPRASPQINRVNEELAKLYSVLIDPITDHLPDNPEDRIIFIPQGDIFQVAFPALRSPEGQYLIEHHTVLTAPSVQTLALTQALRQTQQQRTASPLTNSLVVGNPVMPSLPTQPGTTRSVSLTRLPGAEQEATTIAEILNTTALTGASATESTVTQKMKTAPIIHLATHGLLDYGTPEVSLVRDIPGAIALAPDTQLHTARGTSRDAPGDGLLTARELMALDLQAELVVLSACNTGRGEITADGVMGLSRSLMIAGVPSVVVSLWAVPDAPTSVLMAEFYRQLQETPDKAQALRQAMLTTLETHPNPVDWSGFTLIGEAQ